MSIDELEDKRKTKTIVLYILALVTMIVFCIDSFVFFSFMRCVPDVLNKSISNDLVVLFIGLVGIIVFLSFVTLWNLILLLSVERDRWFLDLMIFFKRKEIIKGKGCPWIKTKEDEE